MADHESGPHDVRQILDTLHPPAKDGGEWMRWLIGLALAALVSYVTAIGATNQKLAVVETTQQNQFSEVLRRLDSMQADIRELRKP